jgi:hypothetical protein
MNERWKKRKITKERERDRKRERRTEITHRVREADSKRFKRYCLEMVGLNHGEDPYPRVCWGGACVTLGDRSRSPTRGKRRFAIISGTSTAVVIKVIRSAFTFFSSLNWVLLDFLCAGCIFAIVNFSRDIKRTHARPPMALNPQLHSLLLQARDRFFPEEVEGP